MFLSLFGCAVLCVVSSSSHWGREGSLLNYNSLIGLLMSLDCYFSVPLPHGAVGWPVMCD